MKKKYEVSLEKTVFFVLLQNINYLKEKVTLKSTLADKLYECLIVVDMFSDFGILGHLI